MRASSSAHITADVREAGAPFAQEPHGFPRGVWAPEATSPAPCQPPAPATATPPDELQASQALPLSFLFPASSDPPVQTLLGPRDQQSMSTGALPGRESLSAPVGRGSARRQEQCQHDPTF